MQRWQHGPALDEDLATRNHKLDLPLFILTADQSSSPTSSVGVHESITGP